MKVLAIDVGGTHVKAHATGFRTPLKFISGPTMTPKEMVPNVKELAANWKYDAVSVGYPGPVLHGRILHEPHNLAPGRVKFDFRSAFGCYRKATYEDYVGLRGPEKCGKKTWRNMSPT